MQYHIHFETLGCRLNQIESESAARSFYDVGFSVDMENTTAAEKPTLNTILCVINTCTVTTKAEQKARRIIRLLLKKYPQAAIIVTGCYAQVESEQIAAIDARIAVLPGMNKGRIADVPSELNDYLSKLQEGEFDAQNFASHLSSTLFLIPAQPKSENPAFIGFSEKPFRLSTDTFLSHSRSSLKIQDGCNCVCTYCRIHIARGNSVSLDVDSVLERVKELQKAGQSEVVITTVNIAQYRGEYNGKKVDFTGLLEILLEQTQGISFRLSSLYPEIVDERFASLIKDERVRPHFHLSIQSGSDRILKLMKRPYEVAQVYKAIELLKQAKQNPFIACDIIAGFPGETDEDFAETLKLSEWANFTWIHAFPFSPRPGTVAFSMKPQIPQSVTGKRVDQLLSLATKNKIEYISQLSGNAVSAVAESLYKSKVLTNSVLFRAVTDNFLHCVVDSCGQPIPQPGTPIRLKIVKPLEDEIKSGKEEEVFAKLVKILE